MNKRSEDSRPDRRPSGRTRRGSSAARRSRPRTQQPHQPTSRSSAAKGAHPEHGRGRSEGFVDTPTQARSARAAATSASPSSSATTTARTRPDGRMQQLWQLWRPHVKRFGPSLLINHAVTLAVIISIAVVVGVGPGFAYVPAVIGSLWMHVNLAPLHMGGVTLGFAPLLPALGIVWWHARRTTKALGNSVSVRGLRLYAAMNIGIAWIMTIVAWLMLWDASRVFDLAPPNLGVALLSALLVNGASVVIGMRPRVWRALLLRKGIGTWPVDAFIVAGRFLKYIVLAGGAAAALYALYNFQAVRESFEITQDTTGGLGLVLLSLLYLPNIAVGAAGVLMGGEFHIGHGMVSLFSVTNVNVPPTPISATIPHGTIPHAAVLLIVPVALAIWLAYRHVAQRDYIEAPLATAVGAGVVAAFVGFCLSWLGGGELGVYGHTGPLEWLFAVEAAGWVLVPTLILMLWAQRAGQSVVEDTVDSADADVAGSEDAADDEDSAGQDVESEDEQPEDREAEDLEAEDREAEAEDSEAEAEAPEGDKSTQEHEAQDEDSSSSVRDRDASPERD
ncbi:DUF6350 family protein [Corynebacterium sp. zg254]|uniref:cell division protein PerM n=1 Tax=Corynebacterium sp. zg254 TaxID=2656645 RepID=UPI002151A838|nr:DUF6350 family protein [Corynebacterium sp. zg254]